jgi:hypothetical protein
LHLSRLKTWDREENFPAKAALDFSFALESCLTSAPRAKYIALFEEDILLAQGWHARTRAALIDIETRFPSSTTALSNQQHPHHRGGWLDLRLFNPDRARGYASHTLWGNNVPLISLAINSSLLTLILILRHRRSKLAASPWLSNSTLLVLTLFTIPLAVTVFFATGKLSVLPPRAGVTQQDWGCCTQALILPRRRVRGLINALQEYAGQDPPDLLVKKYAAREGLSRWVLDPVMVQHLGVQGSVISPEKKAGNEMWSLGFEDLKGEGLEREQGGIVERLYGGSEGGLLMI